MGSFVFKWPHAAKEVFVTGTFDDWGKTVQLEKKGDIFEKEVEIPKAEKIYYKFVVDGTWTTDHTAPQEDDGHANVNNILNPENIAPKGGIAGAVRNSAGAGSTTAGLAGGVPLESKREDASPTSPPGAFPETPAHEPQEFSVKPIPASQGTGNPIDLKPGEKVPEPTGDRFYSSVTQSQEDYEKAGSAALPAAAAGVAGGAAAGNEFSVPEKSQNLIPESSLPIRSADPTIQSAGAGTTTAALAGQQPLEAKRQAVVVDDGENTATGVPEAVKESIAESNEGPEAAANPEAVREKSAVESELLKDVPRSEATGEHPPTSKALSGESLAAAGAATGATVGAATAAVTSAVTGKDSDATPHSTSDEVPEVVKESIAESHQGPEATTNPEAVAEKSAVEAELLKEVKTTDETGEPAPTTSAATTTTAPAPTTADTTSAPAATPTKDGSKPTVTTGVDSSKTAPTSTPSSRNAATPESSAKEDKKKKRLSFFGKIKEKLKQ